MAKRKPSTLGESLYWSYANLAMMADVLEDGSEQPSRKHFMIRSRLYLGLCKGTMQVRGFFDDEKLKLKLPQGVRRLAETARVRLFPPQVCAPCAQGRFVHPSNALAAAPITQTSHTESNDTDRPMIGPTRSWPASSQA